MREGDVSSASKCTDLEFEGLEDGEVWAKLKTTGSCSGGGDLPP